MNEEAKTGLKKAKSLCSKSEKCAADIRVKLHQWRVPVAHHDEILKILYDENFISDLRYAESFINDKIYLTKWGRQKVRFALQTKQIDATIIEKAMASIDEERYLAGLKDLMNKKLRALVSESEYQQMAKLMRYAQSRGFLASEISNVLNKII